MKRKARPETARPEKLEVADRLHSAAIHLLRRLRRVDDATGLAAPKLSALSVVVFAGPLTLGELAAAEQVRPPTMTHLVQQLKRAGLVRTETDERDRRVTRVHATVAGKRLLRQGRSRRVALLAEWLGTLSAAEFALLSHGLLTLEKIARPGSSEP